MKAKDNQKASSWLEQIRGRDDDDGGEEAAPAAAAAAAAVTIAGPQKMAVEMNMNKLMALQSLQNSLQLITMGITATQQQQHNNPLERLRHLQQQQSVIIEYSDNFSPTIGSGIMIEIVIVDK